MQEQSGKNQGIEAGNHSDLLESYEFCFKNSPDAIFLGNPDGTIYKCNPVATTLFGYTEEEFYALGRDAIFDKNDPFLIQGLNEKKKNKELSGIFPHVKKDGTHV
jgi:PAS domain S-box-containing protein